MSFLRCGGGRPVAAQARQRLSVLLLLLQILSPSIGAALDASDLCPPTANPCLVTSAFEDNVDSVVDVGDRELQIIGNGEIVMRGADLTLRARRVATGTGSLIRTSGATRTDPAGRLEIVADDVLLTGDIDVRGAPAGDIDISGTSTLSISGEISGGSVAADESASTVNLLGGNIALTGKIELDGGRDDTGGDLTVSGSIVTVSGELDVRGGDGGSVDITGTDILTIASSASILTRATTAAGDGGDVMLLSDDTVDLRGSVSANGRDGGEEGGGDGGQVTIAGDLQTLISDPAAVVEALGGSPDGLAGDIEVTSLFGAVEIAGFVDAGSEERDGVAGSIDVDADTTVSISGTLMARGALGGSGEVSVEAEQAATLANDGTLDASAARASTAGSVSFSSAGTTTVNGSLLATTSATDGGGGIVTIGGCEVTVGANAVIRSSGSQSINQIRAFGPIVVRGEIEADGATGANTFRYPDEVPEPDTAGSTIDPPPTLIPDMALVPCEPIPPTPTPSASPTPTPTIPPPACPGDCDGDGTVSISELVRAVNIALGSAAVETCLAADTNSDGQVSINELIQGVNAALDGCGA